MKIIKSPIISASRRTDIPAFLMDWVISKIQQQYVRVTNPFNRNQVSTISLDPKNVLAWVWWSKDFQPWIDSYNSNPQLFTQYPIHIFNFTINSASELESGLKTSLEKRFEQLNWLIDVFGIDHVQVRFDPIVYYRKTGSDLILNNLSDFDEIVAKFSQVGIRKVIFSFMEVYSKVKKRMMARGKEIITLTKNQKKKIMDNLVSCARDHHITLFGCCQSDLVGYKGIGQSHCIDGQLIRTLSGVEFSLKRDTGQRNSCGCQKSRDIGGYTGIFKCKHNCDYCYANPTRR